MRRCGERRCRPDVKTRIEQAGRAPRAAGTAPGRGHRVNHRGDKEFFQPFIAVHAHDHEIGAALLDLLRNDLRRCPAHNETLNRLVLWAYQA